MKVWDQEIIKFQFLLPNSNNYNNKSLGYENNSFYWLILIIIIIKVRDQEIIKIHFLHSNMKKL